MIEFKGFCEQYSRNSKHAPFNKSTLQLLKDYYQLLQRAHQNPQKQQKDPKNVTLKRLGSTPNFINKPRLNEEDFAPISIRGLLPDDKRITKKDNNEDYNLKTFQKTSSDPKLAFYYGMSKPTQTKENFYTQESEAEGYGIKVSPLPIERAKSISYRENITTSPAPTGNNLFTDLYNTARKNTPNGNNIFEEKNLVLSKRKFSYNNVSKIGRKFLVSSSNLKPKKFYYQEAPQSNLVKGSKLIPISSKLDYPMRYIQTEMSNELDSPHYMNTSKGDFRKYMSTQTDPDTKDNSNEFKPFSAGHMNLLTRPETKKASQGLYPQSMKKISLTPTPIKSNTNKITSNRRLASRASNKSPNDSAIGYWRKKSEDLSDYDILEQ